MESSFSPSSDLFLAGVCSLHNPVLAPILRSCQANPVFQHPLQGANPPGGTAQSLQQDRRVAPLWGCNIWQVCLWDLPAACLYSVATAAWNLLCRRREPVPGAGHLQLWAKLPGHIFYCISIETDSHFLFTQYQTLQKCQSP